VRGVKIAMCHYQLRPNQFKELRNENLLNSQSHCVEPERTAEFNLHRLQTQRNDLQCSDGVVFPDSAKAAHRAV